MRTPEDRILKVEFRGSFLHIVGQNGYYLYDK